MSILIDILLIILLLAATATCIYLILAMRKLVYQVDELHKDVKQLVDNTIPVLKNLNEVTLKANRIVSSAEEYWDGIEHSIEKVRMKIASLKSMRRFDGADIPGRNLIQNIKAFSKGITAFWEEIKRR